MAFTFRPSLFLDWSVTILSLCSAFDPCLGLGLRVLCDSVLLMFSSTGYSIISFPCGSHVAFCLSSCASFVCFKRRFLFRYPVHLPIAELWRSIIHWHLYSVFTEFHFLFTLLAKVRCLRFDGCLLVGSKLISRAFLSILAYSGFLALSRDGSWLLFRLSVLV